jgi:hypothetical protein
MHRDDWDCVFLIQDKILKQLKPLNNKMFLAGGKEKSTAIERRKKINTGECDE